jgi:hypothetical protein
MQCCTRSYLANADQLRRGASAKELINSYNLVLVTERFDESLMVLKHVLKLELADLLYIRAKSVPVGYVHMREQWLTGDLSIVAFCCQYGVVCILSLL